MANRLSSEYKDFNWNSVKYAGILIVAAVAISLIVAYEIGVADAAMAVGCACICISGMAQSQGDRR